jgi:MoxR-like ATPase
MNEEEQPVARRSPYRRYTGQAARSYVASPEIAEIVNLAVHLGRPLLVEGEAGCGKTRLAHAIAEELGLRERFVATTVKSTSQARNLLYRFDALRRLQDAQRPGSPAESVWPYIELEPLGKALRAGQPALVLIDEIDKADIDFPNDLLDVLDRFEFEIDDLPERESEACLNAPDKGFGRRVSPPADGVKPIVVITSNREKQLPEPFLRRCLYVELAFPQEPATLEQIVAKNLRLAAERVSEALVAVAVRQFLAVRQRSQDRGLQKPPATSELVDWVRALHWQKRPADKVSAERLDAGDRAILFKLQKDLERWDSGAEGAGR